MTYTRINRNSPRQFLRTLGVLIWDSRRQGTYNVGRNKAKRERRAMRARWPS
jgi:hypothetical protein